MDLLQKARALYLAGDTHQALEVAQKAAENHARDAEAWWLLACISRHEGLPGASDEAFRRAAAISKKRPEPARIAKADFEAICTREIAALSADARRRLGAARLRIEVLPGLADIRAGVPPDALISRRRVPEDEVTLFQGNVENRCGTVTEIRKLVGRTLARA